MDKYDEKYEAEGGDYVPVDQWGKDHWSTLAHAESRAVNHGGVIHNPHMRCNPRLHRRFAHHSWDGRDYPTNLREGQLTPHDDWSCIEDMVAAGLLTAEW